MTWKCRALLISKDGLFDPSIVPFSPVWTVIFNSRFFPFDDTELLVREDDEGFRVGSEVIAWKNANASERMEVFGSGEVICESESDANLLFMRFR